MACCGGALTDCLRLGQEHVGVEARDAGALVWHDRVPYVDVFVRQVVGTIVFDRFDDVRAKGLLVSGDLVGLPVGGMVDFLATHYYQLLMVNLSVRDRAGVEGA